MKKILGIILCIILATTAVPTVNSLDTLSNQHTTNNTPLQNTLSQQKAIIFGQIKNFTTYDDTIIFQAVKLKVITFSPFSFNPYTAGEYFEILKEHKGFIGIQNIFAFVTLHTPELVCSRDDFIDRIRVISIDITIKWRDIEITLDKSGATYQIFTKDDIAIAPVNNTAFAGAAVISYHDYIQLSTYIGDVTATLRYIPTNTIMGSWTIHI